MRENKNKKLFRCFFGGAFLFSGESDFDFDFSSFTCRTCSLHTMSDEWWTEEFCEKGLEIAIQQAEKSFKEGGIPIGASILSHDSVLLSSGHNQRVQKNSWIHHGLWILPFRFKLSSFSPPFLFKKNSLKIIH